MSSILIATDGSSLRTPSGGVGGPIGWAWAREDGAWLSGGLANGTNQRAELLGLLMALKFHPKGKLTIQLDSQYALNTAEKWMWGWAKNNWRKSDGKDVINVDIISQIHAHLISRSNLKDIEYQWVRGHDKNNSHPLNTEADLRATDASGKIRQSNGSIINLYLDSKGRTEHSIHLETVSLLQPYIPVK